MQKTSSFFKKTTILMALTAACLSPNANAANWLMLQGTESQIKHLVPNFGGLLR